MLPIVGVLVLCGLIAWATTDRSPPAPSMPASLPTAPAAPQSQDATSPASSPAPTPLPRAAAAAQLSPEALARLPAIERHAHLLRLQPGSTLVLTNEDNRLGVHHHRYEQDYRGVRVAQRNFVVNEYADGRPPWVSGFTIQGLAEAVPSVTPRLSAAQAMDIGARMAMETAGGRVEIEDRRVELRIHIADDRPHLAYLVTIDGHAPDSGEPFAPAMVIDAGTGALLDQWDDVVY
jgi:Zn-dependent metalloprotease